MPNAMCPIADRASSDVQAYCEDVKPGDRPAEQSANTRRRRHASRGRQDIPQDGMVRTRAQTRRL